MPSAGFSHFYKGHVFCLEEETAVSMPSAGFSHFYVNNSMTFPLRKVSMPSAGFSHFYEGNKMKVKIENSCVNALGGLFSFLRLQTEIWIQYGLVVSMPSAGFSHFYSTLWEPA